MALAANQTVKIVVTLDTNAAKRELESVHGQARQGAAKQGGGGGGAGIMRPGRFMRGGVRGGRAGSGLLGRSMRSGLGRLAGRAARGAGGRLLQKATQFGTQMLGRTGLGAGIAATATAASAAIIGLAVKMYIDKEYPELGEALRKMANVDKIMAALTSKSNAATKFGEFEKAFANLGVSMPDSLRMNEAINRVTDFNADVDAQRESIQRRNMKAGRKGLSMGEIARRDLLGTTAGQVLATAPDMRAALLKMIGMRS